MAFDGIATACVASELKNTIAGGRIDKITQPQRDEINITVRSGGQNYKLLINANTMSARIHLTSEQKESPEMAPMFCMLLRKHLSGGRIVAFEQPDFERVLKIKTECYDELGNLSKKTLIAEIMGKHSNIILTDSEDIVLGSIKHVDFTVSSLRQLLPGMKYEMPPSQCKQNPLKISRKGLLALINESKSRCDTFILETFTGIGPLNAREIAFAALGDMDLKTDALTELERQRLANSFISFFKKVETGAFKPVLLYKITGVPWDFNATEVTQYQGAILIKPFKTLSAAIDFFISDRFSTQIMSEKTAGLQKFLDNNINRCKKKVFLLQNTIKQAQKREQHKIFGDLLTSNLHLIPQKAASFETENYYSNMEKVEIPLSSELSPVKNAQRYYKLYQKAKNAERMSTKQLKLAKEELLYLESVADSVSRAENANDIEQIKEELSQQGYKPKGMTMRNKKKAIMSAPHTFCIDGFTVCVGRNNMQNDVLTLKRSQKQDLWFHAKNFPGSHTVMKITDKLPSNDTIVTVAKIAAYFSKAKNSANVPVDFTEIKNVKKPSGSKPGMVIYENYSTVNVKPEKPQH